MKQRLNSITPGRSSFTNFVSRVLTI